MPSGRDVITAPVTAGVSARADHGVARRPGPVTAGGTRCAEGRPMRPSQTYVTQARKVCLTAVGVGGGASGRRPCTGLGRAATGRGLGGGLAACRRNLAAGSRKLAAGSRHLQGYPRISHGANSQMITASTLQSNNSNWQDEFNSVERGSTSL